MGTLHHITKPAKSVTRRAGMLSMTNAEKRMMASINECSRLETMAAGYADENKAWLADVARNELREELLIAATAMKTVILFRIQLGLPPHPLCQAHAIATGIHK